MKLIFATLLIFVASVTAGPVFDPTEGLSNIFMNDMRFLDEPELFGLEKQGNPRSSSRWPNKEVPYRIDSKFSSSERKVVTDGMKMISDNTCIRFREPTNRDSTYVDIRRGGSGSGCYSYVGRVRRGAQELNLEAGSRSHCMQAGVAAHELIHAIGFYHEMSRPDRDDHIQVLWENIQRGAEGNFDKEDDALTYKVPYDLMSIMHYGSRAASKNGKPTMVNREGREVKMGQIEKLTKNDIDKINRMYGC